MVKFLDWWQLKTLIFCKLLLAISLAQAQSEKVLAKNGPSTLGTRVRAVDLPSVSFRDLQRNTDTFSRGLARHAFAELGALEVTDVPGFANIRQVALQGSGRCLKSAGLKRLLPDGSVRTSLGGRTGSSGLLGPLDEENRGAGVLACDGPWRAEADQLRLLMRAVALQAVSTISGLNASWPIPASLDHFHLYQPASGTLEATRGGDSEPDYAIPLHIDAGYLIAATAGLTPSGQNNDDARYSEPVSGPLIIQRADGELISPRVRSDAVLLMAGAALATLAPARIRAVPHALQLRGTSARSWFGSMLLPEDFLTNSPEIAAAKANSVACFGATVPTMAMDLANTCSEGHTWCWMQCMPVPPACSSNLSQLRCEDKATGFLWPGGQIMCQTCGATCPAEQSREEEGQSDVFCQTPGTDMLMQGFSFSGDPNNPCIVYLLSDIVLDSRLKFWTAVALTFALTSVGPEVLRRCLSGACSLPDDPALWWRVSKFLLITLMNVLSVVHAYFIMLLSMSFSVEMFLSIVIGLALGRSLPWKGGSKGFGTLCCRFEDPDTPMRETFPALSGAHDVFHTLSDNSVVRLDSFPLSRRILRARVELSIGGMTCSTCSGAVERALIATEGVLSAEVYLLQERAIVTFNAEVTTALKICTSIEDVGFDGSILRETSTKSVRQVPVIPCPPKETRLAKLQENDNDFEELPAGVLHLKGTTDLTSLSSAGGVGFLGVSQLPAGSKKEPFLRVVYDPHQVGARTLLSRFTDAGLGVSPHDSPPPLSVLVDGGRAEQHELQVAIAFQSAVIPAIIAVFVLVLVMSPMFLSGVSMEASDNIFSLVMLVIIALVANWTAFMSPAGRYFLSSAMRAIRHGAFTMDVLVGSSISVSCIYGLGLTLLCFSGEKGSSLAQLRGSAAHFLAMAPVLLLAVLGGKKLELSAKQRTASALTELLSEQPTRASVRLKGGSDIFEDLPLELIEIGDLCRVTMGNRFPAEGCVIEGSGTVDQSLVTGEASPVEKKPGAPLGSSKGTCMAGTTLTSGDIIIRVTAVGPATTLGRLADLVARAQGSKPSIQRIADTLAAKFVPSVMALAVVTTVVWLYLLLSGRVSDAPLDLALKICWALQYGLSVMMLACPCAMGLATPTAISVAVGVASQRHHCLVRNAAVLERGSSRGMTAIVLDKTGTCTEGKPRVVSTAFWTDPGRADAGLERWDPNIAPQRDETSIEVEWLSEQRAERMMQALWAGLGAAEAAAPHHPIATALDRFSESQAPGVRASAIVMPGHLEHVAGSGLIADVKLSDKNCSTAISISVGGMKMLEELESKCPEVPWSRFRAWAHRQTNASLVFVAMGNGAVAAAMALRDPIRTEAKLAVDAIVAAYGGTSRCEVWLCSGDTEGAATAVADVLGIDRLHLRFNQLPTDKCTLVDQLQSKGAAVIMVGDGLNDAPALAKADMGVAIGAGAQLACDAADVVLCRSSLLDLLAFRELCLATRVTIYRNFLWAFCFNVFGLPLAAGCGYPWGISISPMFAGMAMAGSSVLVVTSSLFLQRFKPSLDIDGGSEGRNEKRTNASVHNGLQEPLLSSDAA